MGKVYTNWTHATQNPNEAMIGLVSCLEHNKNAWIEVMKNGDQDLPIMRKNPLLDNPFNWEASYGTQRNKEEMAKHCYFNETEKDLTYNWTDCLGTKEAVEAYQKDGTIMEGLILGGSVQCPVRVEDANAYRRDIQGDNYQYGFFVTYWKPKEGIKHWIVDDRVGDVFVICYDDGPINKMAALRRAAQFMNEYADRIQMQICETKFRTMIVDDMMEGFIGNMSQEQIDEEFKLFQKITKELGVYINNYGTLGIIVDEEHLIDEELLAWIEKRIGYRPYIENNKASGNTFLYFRIIDHAAIIAKELAAHIEV